MSLASSEVSAVSVVRYAFFMIHVFIVSCQFILCLLVDFLSRGFSFYIYVLAWVGSIFVFMITLPLRLSMVRDALRRW